MSFLFVAVLIYVVLCVSKSAHAEDIQVGYTDNETNDELLLLKRLLNQIENKDVTIKENNVTRSRDESPRTSTSELERSCESEEFECRDHNSCIHDSWLCDGVVDCGDESDETECFECELNYNGHLIAYTHVCDGVADCTHGEDEHGCKAKCDYGEFQCHRGDAKSKCIPKDWMCDGYIDCPDFEDEVVAMCGDLSDRCSPKDFICQHKQFCVSKSWRCDGANDCGDGSDELDCEIEKSAQFDENDEDAGHHGKYIWTNWSTWSSCDSPCDGEQIRTRRCNFGKCNGRTTEMKTCGETYPCTEEPSSGCGIRSFDLPMGRIFGGRDAQMHEWPWQVQIFRPGKSIPFCGGSLIRKNWVLTAAHCFNKKKYSPNKYTIALGRQHTSRSIDDDEQILVSAKSIIVHKSYKSMNHRDDIALIELAKHIPESAGINVVCLPNPDDDWLKYDLEQLLDCYVTGYGINEIGKRPLVLQEAHVHLIDHETCSAAHVYGGRITRAMICAGHLEGGIDACQGDSGGPLVCQNPRNGRWTEIGVTSWGKGCGLPNRPGVYTRITKYIEWINDKIDKSA